ncbi:hypothetical protein ANN_19639 [Periplaneta americana]|uniref:Uncharacterized protein n=1 Tax=Periplaneta americana TaxID=6978 RepID=A0ABQ8SBJ8_PERAM|nr:hypothetical protein ANN_19639 [Periplaneta americana]
MVGSCEGGNEPPGSLKLKKYEDKFCDKKALHIREEVKKTQKHTPMSFSLTPTYEQTQSKALRISDGI